MKYVFMRYPGGKAKAVTFSYDDGVVQDKQLAEIFDKYGLKATFNFMNINPKRHNFSKEEIKEYFLSKGHEIAVHGAHHRANGNVRTIEGIREVLDCRLELEERCDSIIRGMAYPDTGIRVCHTPYDTVASFFQFKTTIQYFPDSLNGSYIAICAMMCAVHSDFVALGKKIFFNFLFGKVVPLWIDVHEIKSCLQAILVKDFGKLLILHNAIIIAEGDSFCFSSRISHKNIFHNNTP